MSGDVHVRFCESPGVKLPRATHLVIVVCGTREQAGAIKNETATLLRERLRLTLNDDKTRVTHVTDGFDFLGFCVRLLPHHSTGKLAAFTFPSRRAYREIKYRIKQLTRRSMTTLSLDTLVYTLNPLLRGWTNYFRYASSKRTFSALNHFLWNRVIQWVRKKHKGISWKQLRRRFWSYDWRTPTGARIY